MEDSHSIKTITAEHPIAYFCAEYAISDELPIYSGGLGILAGDMLREAAKQHTPLVAIGLLYKEGYFTQTISESGTQTERPAYLDLEDAPINLLKQKDGSAFQLKIFIEDRIILVQVWTYSLDNITLYLLDTDVPENSPLDRRLTLSLYPSDSEWRIQQEIILGVGGARTLAHLGLEPALYHLNEGHSAFALLEIAHQHMKKHLSGFSEAFEFAKQRVIFTNHTLIPSGNDIFDRNLVERLLTAYAKHLGLGISEVLEMGTIPSAKDHFSMTYLALKESALTSAVSKSHAQFAKVTWPNSTFVPITNGVERNFWQAEDFHDIYDRLADGEEVEDGEIWEAHQLQKHQLFKYLQKTLGVQLNVETLTLSWARRITSYKQPMLLFSDLEKLLGILQKTGQSVQIILAGKAHPNDLSAKVMIGEICALIPKFSLEKNVVFLPNYSLTSAKLLVSGSDIWLNTPIKGQEACGTSGMKSAMNGGLQFAISDGWTDEVPLHELGFPISPIDSGKSLYSTLEEVIVPLYYHNRAQGLPTDWISKMRQTILKVSGEFSAERMLQEYVEKLYKPVLARLT